MKNACQFLKQLVVLVMIIWKFNAVYIWFADYHSFLPVLIAKILKKKSFVVIGGYDVARILREYKFMIIGMNKNLTGSFFKSLPLNIEFIESVKHNELEYFYKKAKIYCQFSRSESFGVSIVEAMNFGCTPIVTNVGGMPEVIGQSGKIVRRDISLIAEEVKTSITLFEKRTIEEEITSKFSLKMRSSLLISIIS